MVLQLAQHVQLIQELLVVSCAWQQVQVLDVLNVIQIVDVVDVHSLQLQSLVRALMRDLAIAFGLVSKQLHLLLQLLLLLKTTQQHQRVLLVARDTHEVLPVVEDRQIQRLTRLEQLVALNVLEVVYLLLDLHQV